VRQREHRRGGDEVAITRGLLQCYGRGFVTVGSMVPVIVNFSSIYNSTPYSIDSGILLTVQKQWEIGQFRVEIVSNTS
jgi:hypothetical protein